MPKSSHFIKTTTLTTKLPKIFATLHAGLIWGEIQLLRKRLEGSTGEENHRNKQTNKQTQIPQTQIAGWSNNAQDKGLSTRCRWTSLPIDECIDQLTKGAHTSCLLIVLFVLWCIVEALTAPADMLIELPVSWIVFCFCTKLRKHFGMADNEECATLITSIFELGSVDGWIMVKA